MRASCGCGCGECLADGDADGRVDDDVGGRENLCEVAGKRAGDRGDVDAVTYSSQAARQGLGLSMADVGFNIVLPDEEPASHARMAAQADLVGAGARHELGDPRADTAAPPDMHVLALERIDGAAGRRAGC